MSKGLQNSAPRPRKAAKYTGFKRSSNANRSIMKIPESNNTFSNSVSRHEDSTNSCDYKKKRSNFNISEKIILKKSQKNLRKNLGKKNEFECY